MNEGKAPFAMLFEKWWLEWRQRLSRLDRILQLSERFLEWWSTTPPHPETFSDNVAFRWDARRGPGRLRPVDFRALETLDDLLGVERALERLVRNTEQFVRRLPANHVLLYGERGTGKSTAVRALLPRFEDWGLRIVEVSKEDLIHLPEVLAALRDARYRFLLFCDDLSFDEGEPGYRELKAALEGSLEAPPENVRVIVTSNRRHLIPERMTENRASAIDDNGEIRLAESLEEKLALADRFGLALRFTSFDQNTYLAIVKHYLEKAKLSELPEAEIQREALRFALDRSSRSGRTAKQFVDDLAGRIALGEEFPFPTE